jgi:hypothetical protein
MRIFGSKDITMSPFIVEKPVDPESVNIDSGRLAKVVERFHTQQQS